MTHVATQASAFNQAAAEAFAETVGEMLNAGATGLMISIGHRTGLFDTMASRPAGTSGEIADAAGLNERYVREWLAAMVVGGVIDYDPKTKTYRLPDERAACLTREATLGNLAVYAQFVPMFGAVQDRILECFRTGEGLRYGEYPCFHTIMAEDSAQTVVAAIHDTVSQLMPEMPDRLAAGIDVMDAGCGSGRALIALAKRHPTSRFVGYDLSPDAVASAEASAREAGVSNIRFEVRDLTGFRDRQAYDLITSFDAVHDQKDPQALLSGIHASLRPGGVHLMQDIGGSAQLENNRDFPFAPFLYTASCIHCMPVSLGQGGAGLGTMWGWETAEAMLRQAGFGTIERTVLEHDPMNVWFVSRKA